MDSEQKHERWVLQRIGILERNYIFQPQLSLRFSISDERTGWRPRLTTDCELVGLGGPIIIEEFLEIDHLSSPGFLHPP